MDQTVPRLLHALLVAYQLTTSISPTIFIQPMQTCIQHEAVGLLYSFMHSVSLVFKYWQRHGPNSLQATTRAHCSTPTNNVHHTQKYSNDACKSVFRSKRILSSIHSCILYLLYSNTGRDMDQIVSRLLHVLTVAHQPTMSTTLRSIQMMHAKVCSDRRGYSPLFIDVFTMICIQISSIQEEI